MVAWASSHARWSSTKSGRLLQVRDATKAFGDWGVLQLPSSFSVTLFFLLNYCLSYCVLSYCPDAVLEDGEAVLRPNLGIGGRADWKLGPNYWPGM